MLQNVILIASGILAGAIVALKMIAPKTANTTDDAVLARLEQVEAILAKLTGTTPAV